MLQNLAAEIINCYEHARLAHEKADRAINEEFKADFLAAEGPLGAASAYCLYICASGISGSGCLSARQP